MSTEIQRLENGRMAAERRATASAQAAGEATKRAIKAEACVVVLLAAGEVLLDSHYLSLRDQQLARGEMRTAIAKAAGKPNDA